MVALNVLFALVIMFFLLFAAFVLLMYFHNSHFDSLNKKRFKDENLNDSQND